MAAVNINQVLLGLISFMATNTRADHTQGVGYLVTQHGLTIENSVSLLSLLNDQIIDSGRLTAPAGWDAVRDEVVAMGVQAATAWYNNYVGTPAFSKKPGVQLIVLTEAVKDVQPALESQQVLIDAADGMLSDPKRTPEEIDLINLGKGMAESAKLRISRIGDNLNQQIAALQ